MVAKERMHIALCLDRGYVMPTGVMMYSVCANNLDAEIDFHVVVDESVTDKDKKDIEDTIFPFEGKEILFYHVNSQFYHQFPLNNKISLTRATYYRLFLPSILPNTINKVLYLDGDCIIRHSLISLWNTDLANHAVGAVIDKLASDISLFDRLGYPNEKGYFNAGVLLINLEKWRIDHIEDDFVAVLNNYSDRIKYEDQDVLNVVLQDKKIFIPIKYNFQTPFFRKTFIWGYRKYEEEFKQDLNDPVIVHYSTSNKPWNWNSYDPHPYKSTFCKYQNMTIWSYKTLNRPSFIRMAKYVIGDFLRQIKIKAPLQSSYINIPPID